MSALPAKQTIHRAGAKVRYRRLYCCADTLPTRVFTQPGPKADLCTSSANFAQIEINDPFQSIEVYGKQNDYY